MPRLNKQAEIERLTKRVNEMVDCHAQDKKHEAWQSQTINTLREHIKSLESDKAWLKSMHSQWLQATHEMFRNR